VHLAQAVEHAGEHPADEAFAHFAAVAVDVVVQGTAALELQLTGKTRSLSTMCIGVGQGIAVALERA